MVVMLKKVLGNDISVGFIGDYFLEDFIRAGTIATFFRPNTNVWFDIKHVLIRRYGSKKYKGPDKRYEIRGEASGLNERES